MKKTFLIITAIATTMVVACGGGSTSQQTNNANTDTDTVNQSDVQPTPQEVQQPSVSDNCDMEDILKQFPKKYLPEEMRNFDLVLEMKKRAEGGDDSYEIQCDRAFLDHSEGECDYTDIMFHSFKKNDGSLLVLYTSSGGCDCSVMLNHKAFNYSSGKLTETAWPFEEPNFEEFFNSISLYGVQANHIKESKSDGKPFYQICTEKENAIRCNWSVCDYFDFIEYQRPILYTWNGSSFDKSYLPFRMCGEKNFGGIKLGDNYPNNLDGFKITAKEDEYNVKITDAKTGNLVAEIETNQFNKVFKITVLSPDYCTEDFIPVGTQVNDIITRSPNKHRAFDWDGDGDETHRLIVVETYSGKFGVERQYFEFEHIDNDCGFDPVKYTLSAPVKAIVITDYKCDLSAEYD